MSDSLSDGGLSMVGTRGDSALALPAMVEVQGVIILSGHSVPPSQHGKSRPSGLSFK